MTSLFARMSDKYLKLQGARGHLGELRGQWILIWPALIILAWGSVLYGEFCDMHIYRRKCVVLADTMYLPERCTTSSLTGFNRGVVISQRGERYLPDTDCTLHLRVRSSARAIRFTFEHMDLPEVRPGLCEDYVEFRTPSPDAEADDSVAGKFCGRTIPQDFFSNGTSVLVRFTSNSIRERSGFRFRFERISYAVDLCAGRGSSPDCIDVTGHHVFEHLTDAGRCRITSYYSVYNNSCFWVSVSVNSLFCPRAEDYTSVSGHSSGFWA